MFSYENLPKMYCGHLIWHPKFLVLLWNSTLYIFSYLWSCYETFMVTIEIFMVIHMVIYHKHANKIIGLHSKKKKWRSVWKDLEYRGMKLPGRIDQLLHSHKERFHEIRTNRKCF